MTGIADALKDVPQRRKILLFIGRTMPIQSQGDCAGLQREGRTALVKAARVANLTIHVIDPSGLEGYIDAGQRSAGSPNGPSPWARNIQRQGNLGYLPDATGGRVVLNTNTPEDNVFGILRETSAYYVLGFEPAARTDDGRFHDIKVKVNRPDITVQTRRGYYAAGGKRPKPPAGAADASSSLVEAVTGLWPRKAVPLSITAAPFATADGTGATAAIVLHVRQDEAGMTGTVDVLAGAFDRFGKGRDFQRQTVTVSPPLNGNGEFEYEVLSKLPLEPGRYEIRAALEDATKHRTGSVYTYVEVPNFAKEPLSVSGVVVDARPAVPSTPPVAFAGFLPVTPRARRTFGRNEEAAAFMRIYQARDRGLAAVSVAARILDADDRAVFQQTTSMRPADFGGDYAADYTLELPLSQLRPGEHLLRVEAMRGASQVRREFRFTVK